MKKLLVIVDMQKDFIDGSLGTEEAVAIVPKVKQKIEDSIAMGAEVVFTRDTHHNNYLDTNEGKHLPVVHCIEGTEGWMLDKALIGLADGRRIFDKPSFGSIELMEYVKMGSFDEIELCGLCTDICVISNAMLVKAALPEAVIKVDSTCSAGVSPESHDRALAAMKLCQVEII